MILVFLGVFYPLLGFCGASHGVACLGVGLFDQYGCETSKSLCWRDFRCVYVNFSVAGGYLFCYVDLNGGLIPAAF